MRRDRKQSRNMITHVSDSQRIPQVNAEATADPVRLLQCLRPPHEQNCRTQSTAAGVLKFELCQTECHASDVAAPGRSLYTYVPGRRMHSIGRDDEGCGGTANR